MYNIIANTKESQLLKSQEINIEI